MTDKLNAAVIATIGSFLPVLQLTGVVTLSGDDVSIIMLFVTNTLTTLGLVFALRKPATSTTTLTVTESVPPPNA
jgi:hypothetical protein